MLRRDFFRLLGAAAAGCASARPPPPPQPVAARYRPAAPQEALAKFIDPGHDEFVTERHAEEIAALLRQRRFPLHPDFQGGSPLASGRKGVRSEAGLRLFEATFSRDAGAGSAAFEKGLQALLGEGWKVAEFDVISLAVASDNPLRVEVRVRYELAADTRSRVGHWRQTWEHGAQGWSLLRATSTDEMACETAQPLFQDETNHAIAHLPSYRTQLWYGQNYWRARLDAATGIDVYGENGIAAGDIDNDGWDEVYICQPAGLPNRLLKNRGDGSFEDITDRSGLGLLDDTASALFGDFNNDGRQELIVVRPSGPLLFANRGDGAFRLVADAFRFAQKPQGSFTSIAAADYDGDGLLDLYLCCYVYFQGEEQYRYPRPYHDAQNGPPNFLFHNQDGLRFRDVTAESGMNENNNRYSFAAAWCDYDGDGRPDLYVANDFGRNNLYRNLGGGKFRDVAREAGVEDIGPGMSAAWFDYDNDGRPDLYVSNMWAPAGLRLVEQKEFQPEASPQIREALRRHAKGNSLYHNNGDGTFTELKGQAEMGRWAWASDAADFDNDGWPEIFVAAGMLTNRATVARPDLMSFFWRQVIARSALDARASAPYENGWNALNQWIREDYSWNGSERNVFYLNHRGRFYEVSGVSGLDADGDSRAFAITDWDGDGNLDLILKSRRGCQVGFFRNQCGASRPAIAFNLRGTKSNRDAVGARLEVHTAGGVQVKFLSAGSGYLSQHTKTLSFGLGDAERIEQVKVRWPSGREQVFRALAAGQRHTLVEGSRQVRSQPFRPRQHWQPPAGPVPFASPPGPVWLAAPLHLPPQANLEGGSGFLYLYDQRDAAAAEHGNALITLPVRTLALTPETAATFGVLWRYLFDLRRDLPTPLLILVDRGAAVKVYPGNLDRTSLREDLARLPLDGEALAKLALPFPGPYYGGGFKHNYYRYGTAFYWAGERDLALEYFTLAAREQPGIARTHYALGRLHLESGRAAEARQALSWALELNPNLAEAWNDLGGLALERGDLAEAVAHFRQALEVSPKFSFALLNLGQAYAKTGQTVEAERAFRRALEANPRDPEPANQLGLVLAQQNRADEARRLFQQALEAQPDYPQAINNLGVLYMNTGATNDAIAAFQYGIRVAPDFELCYLNLARIEVGRGRKDKARELMQQLLDRKPESRAARRALEELSR